jgi:hypothetical protein
MNDSAFDLSIGHHAFANDLPTSRAERAELPESDEPELPRDDADDPDDLDGVDELDVSGDDEDAQWDAFIADDDERDPLPARGDFWIEPGRMTNDE